MRASLVLVTVGVLLIVASAFLPWIEISIHRTFPPSTTNTTYALWQLPIWELFPLLVWFPFPAIVRTLLHHQAGKRHLGRLALVLLCLGGGVGTCVFVLLGGFSVAPFFLFVRGVSTFMTPLLGGWICIAGYGVLLVGTLLLGQAPAAHGAGETPPPGDNRLSAGPSGSLVDTSRR